MSFVFNDSWSQFQVNTYEAGNQYNPDVAGLSGGGAVVVWQSQAQDGNFFGIYGQRYGDDGLPAGPEFRINSYTVNTQTMPTVAALDDGGFVVTWVSSFQDGHSDGVFGQRFAADGTPVGAEFQINTYSQDSQNYPDVCALSDGGFLVAWQSIGQDGNGWGVFGQRYDASGAPVGTEFRINTTTNSGQFEVSLAGLETGGFVATWMSERGDGSRAGVFAQQFDAAGSAVGGEFRVNTYTNDDQSFPEVAALDGGGYVVVWTSRNQDGSGQGIYGQRYDSDGTRVGQEFQINTYTLGSQYSPTVAALPDGGFAVAWTYSEKIFGQSFDSNGVKTGVETLINETTGRYQYAPAIAPLQSGGVLTVWQLWDQDRAGFAVVGRGVFSSDGDDRFDGNSQNNLMLGGLGNDTLRGFAGDDTLDGEGGDDHLIGGRGADQMTGGDGNDTLSGGGQADTLHGGEGDDRLVGGTGALTATGGAGNDEIRGHASADTVDGGDGDDWIVVFAGNDSVEGDAGEDTLVGEAGDDTLNGGNGNDLVLGGRGFDLLTGGNDRDTISGGLGDDTILGGAGDDRLLGARDFDRLYGGDGNDTLSGGLGNDWLTGEGGNDVFFFRSGDQRDRITDLDAGDVLRLDFGPDFDTRAEMQAAASQDGADVRIDFGSGDVLTLENYALADLATQDMQFL